MTPSRTTPEPFAPAGEPEATRDLTFGIYFFAGETGDETDKYQFLLDCASVADRRGFTSVWLPERHFHGFGGLYPNPVTLAAALAMSTRRLHLRAGSVVLPLHHPVRVAEEWSVVDNLSGGRVGVSFAPGWHPGDFVLAPEGFDGRAERLYPAIEQVRRLWAGDEVSFPGPDGTARTVRTFPRPLQPQLPWWITSSGNPRTFERAGRAGANILAALIGLTTAELAERVQVYRGARAAAGLDPAGGVVTVMVHAFLGQDPNEVRRAVLEPMGAYLKAYLAQQRDAAVALPSDEDQRLQVEFATERYLSGAALIGTPEHCAEVVERLRACGVNEIACLLDFGVAAPQVLESLERLGHFAAAHSGPVAPVASPRAPSPGSSPPLDERREALRARLAAASVEQRGRLEAAWRSPTTERVERCGLDQARLLRVEHRAPSHAGNNVAGGLLFGAVPEPARLRACLQDVANAHECLHSRFERAAEDDSFVRIVDPALPTPWEERDVRVDLAEGSATLADILSEFAGRPFDLEGGSLMRALFLQTSDEERCLALVVHHSITDWVSMNVVLDQLLDAYALGRAPAAQGQTFTEWVHQEATRASSGALEQDAAFWRDEFASAPEPVVARRHTSKSVHRTFRSARQWFVLDAATSSGMARVARELHCTPFAVGLAAYATLLSRLGDTTDVVLGTPSANREAPGTDTTVGLLMTMLPLRLDLGTATCFADAVSIARDVFARALGHQIPFDEIIRAVHPERRLEHLPLFRSRYLYLRWNPPQQLGSTRVGSLDVDPGRSFYDGTMALWESPRGFFGRWEYDADRYDQEAAREITTAFCNLLSTAVVDPQVPVPAIDFSTSSSRLLDHEQLTAHLRSLVEQTGVS